MKAKIPEFHTNMLSDLECIVQGARVPYFVRGA